MIIDTKIKMDGKCTWILGKKNQEHFSVRCIYVPPLHVITASISVRFSRVSTMLKVL